MASAPRPRDRCDFEIALICALSLEAECVYDVLDKIWDDKKYGKAPSDDNAYTLGVIGEHNVVLIHMPGMGTIRAAYAAANLKVSFPNIKLALVVGICGGMPYGIQNEEILLGDIVISKALIQYDFGKQYPQGFKRKADVLDTLGPPSEKILALLTKLEIRQHMRDMQNNTATFLQAIQQNSLKTKHPGVENDILYHSSYTHKHHSPITCDECGKGDEICEAAIKMECEDLRCESAMRVTRQRLANPSTTEPMIHFGIMGSGDTVMKSGHHRDALAQNERIVAVEMEGAGVWRHGPSIVIKGVCDYADSHKRKGWQRYAAATAAACAKAFLMEWIPEKRQRSLGQLFILPSIILVLTRHCLSSLLLIIVQLMKPELINTFSFRDDA
jgi:nucleoside phosphorylase